jgi:hypothetical protein
LVCQAGYRQLLPRELSQFRVNRGIVSAGMFFSLNAEGAEQGAEGAEKGLLGLWAWAHSWLFRLSYVLTLAPMRPCLVSSWPSRPVLRFLRCGDKTTTDREAVTKP